MPHPASGRSYSDSPLLPAEHCANSTQTITDDASGSYRGSIDGAQHAHHAHIGIIVRGKDRDTVRHDASLLFDLATVLILSIASKKMLPKVFRPPLLLPLTLQNPTVGFETADCFLYGSPEAVHSTLLGQPQPRNIPGPLVRCPINLSRRHPRVNTWRRPSQEATHE